MKYLLVIIMSIPSGLFGAEVNDSALEKCIIMPARLDRLSCYDALFGVAPDAANAQVEGHNRLQPVRKPKAHRHFDRLMASQYETEQGVKVTFWDARAESPIPDLVDFQAFLEEGWGSQSPELFIHDTSIFVAIPALSDLGETGGLVASCENNISHLRFFWNTPVSGRFVEAGLLFGDDVSSVHQKREMTMRISDDGYVINTPRGLEAIEVLKTIGQGPRGQVSIGERETLRSLFFDTGPLADALPIISRHCGWTFLGKVE